jgi:hypothetical protein
MATKSAAPQSLEATMYALDLHSFVPSHSSRRAFWSQLFRHRLAAVGVGVARAASASHLLSAPTVSGA